MRVRFGHCHQLGGRAGWGGGRIFQGVFMSTQMALCVAIPNRYAVLLDWIQVLMGSTFVLLMRGVLTDFPLEIIRRKMGLRGLSNLFKP